MAKFVYRFDEGNAGMKGLLGGKGANLAEMTNLGLPVPKGFTVTTEACMKYLETQQLTDELIHEVKQALANLQKETGKAFSSATDLLLLSVRSGSKFSMPGMMDTILNLGLNDENVERLAQETNDERFAYDCYRRLLQMFGNVVYEIDSSRFENYLDFFKTKHGYESDADFTAEDLKEVVTCFKSIYMESKKKEFPQNPETQLFDAIEAVFRSWNNGRAKVYRSIHDIPDDLGTAVNVQLMVFGNSGSNSATGVAFTRNPATGEKKIFGEYLLNAQGEDVVAGIRTPNPMSELATAMPEAYTEFEKVAARLEAHYEDMQDIEFTIEKGKLYFLQTRNGKRTAQSAFKIAVDLVKEGITTKEKSLMKIDPNSVNQLLHPVFSDEDLKSATLVSAAGLPASPGAASGKIYFDADAAKEHALLGEKVILVRQETSPEDIQGMVSSEAIVTSRGGMTSHAAVVARGMGTCCVAGCGDLEIDEFHKTVTYPGGQLSEGDVISVDGSRGEIYLGDIPTTVTEEGENFRTIMSWADEFARLSVRMNAETVNDIKAGLAFGAAGIGLARTEHMFFGPERLLEMRRFILANTVEERKHALQQLLPFQQADFEQIFKLAGERPVVIRLLDPPLHEFLPTNRKELEHIAKELDMPVQELERRVIDLKEINPMLGHRGCRLAMTYPELYEMQAEAIIRSAVRLKQAGQNVQPEIMIPLVGMTRELTDLTERLNKKIAAVLAETGDSISYTIGTMIELPRACFIADELAEAAGFFSFGTNDLTQMTYGFSRDDSAKYINQYLEDGVLAQDPFQTLDESGVGELIRIAVEKARAEKPSLKIGVCGELGGDAESIAFFHDVGLNYVSCSPFRIPVARIAAAQSAIRGVERN
ncbi:pyruvate, phosphate dikinase [Vagococcus acidifermentans]|uniref:Pyruvate, phosphate dikinase n=1 Tax=Vagococcus acidifermentans TaxID=564710 RepID=A0A430AS63_9ENTE|nr:pyruvate, phosphate dikinase [Vagococcus acidifermentans]RSU10901.1 pyruvate, phosphate dikinase [Vagococcus acidifermentans]